MNLQQIPTIKGATKRRKRVGCGEGGGHGKTCGSGHKGQRSRSGRGIPVGFEGGQMPLYRKLPRRGFNNKNFRTEFETVNVGQLERLAGDTADRATLVEAGLIRDSGLPVKVLGNGDLSKALKVVADKVSASALEKIEKAGGSVEFTGADAQEAADAAES